MSLNKSETPGRGVTVEEVNYLITTLRDLRAEHESLQRRLNLIDDRLHDLEETAEGLDVDDVIVDHEEAEG